MTIISLANVTKTFDSGYTALRDVNLDVEAERFVALVGPSGCGKSTTLSLISGLDRPSSGTLTVRDRPVEGITPGVGFLFQRDALLPWKTVRDNVRLPLQLRGVDAAEMRRRVEEWIARVGLRGFEQSFPYQLSGGMRKRVALAQTLVYDPEILLMDEPFSALDAQSREIMQTELLRIWEQGRKTVLFVTHQIDEAVFLADQIFVFARRPGRVQERVPIALPRPRTLAMKRTPEFVALVDHIWKLIENDVRESVLNEHV